MFEYKRLIAKGGMGEVFLAYDPFVQREVAIKKIRSDLKKEGPLKERFLKEAKITAQLTHPGVITIYSIHLDGEEIYYTMPYVEGKTLKEILRNKPYPTIGYLLPIFKSICQTIAYAHSKKIIHRDIKPENILVGNFGEVILLDWGLAQFISESRDEVLAESTTEEEGITLRGKIVGTLAFMAPERALGAPATFQSDIYALGVMLYQLLTLKVPFQRTTVKEFRKIHHLETLIDPEEMAPYRDVPPRLSAMVKKCLATDLSERYKTVEELLEDLSSHMEGRSQWFESRRLNIERKKDWEFKENILLTKHIAITPEIESTEWVSVMLSKSSFAENTKLETHLTINDYGNGIGFLLNVPEAQEREHPLDGYCIWFGTEEESSAQIYRNQTLVVQIPDLFLTKNQRHTIVIEKVENKIHITLDDVHRFTYISYLPLLGTHVGLLYKDFNFSIDDISVSVSSPTLQVSCLSIPDAFLAIKDYKKAIPEYRRIGYTFPGHAEGREALFKSGITLLEQGKNARSEKRAYEYYTLAIEEFAKLHKTPGAPLEYLGKSLVYAAMREPSEEIKCLEFALRRYHNHPLIHVIEEQILYRMQESAQNDRVSAYELILISLRHLPNTYENFETIRLLKHLITHWESLYFIENPINPDTIGNEQTPNERKENEIAIATSLAFWLANETVLRELYDEISKKDPNNKTALENIIFALKELGIPEPISDETEYRNMVFRMQEALFKDENIQEVHEIAESTINTPLQKEERVLIDAYNIWAYLIEKNWNEAEKIFEKYMTELLNHETTLLHPLYGCFLVATEGEEIALAHLSGVIDVPFPKTYALLGHQLANKILEKPSWFKTSFLWERRHLYRQLALYYHCAGNEDLSRFYQDLAKNEYLKPS